MPARTLSSMCACRLLFSSSANSRSSRLRLKTPRTRWHHRRNVAMTSPEVLRGFVCREEPSENRLCLLPFAGFAGDLLLAGARELIELRAAIVVGYAPRAFDV